MVCQADSSPCNPALGNARAGANFPPRLNAFNGIFPPFLRSAWVRRRGNYVTLVPFTGSIFNPHPALPQQPEVCKKCARLLGEEETCFKILGELTRFTLISQTAGIFPAHLGTV